MDISRTPVKVVVPIYRETLDKYEQFSLNHNMKVLEAYPVVFIRPSGLDISQLLNKYPGSHEEIFDKEYFSNIAGYNRLMMSADFYRRFFGY